MPIDTPEELRTHLELAITVELTTVPPYLYAMYSLADQDGDAALLIRSVVVEEMLHAALMANVLLAVGGEPRFSDLAQQIRYPGPLPQHQPALTVNLEPCSCEVIERVFLTIERPEVHEAPPQPDRYQSLGQFYHALELAIERLDASHDLFADPQLHRQLADPSAYQQVTFDSETSGGLAGVHDRASACQAIETVIHQGEGLSEDRFADRQHRELTHYAKFLDLANGTIPLGAVRPAVTNPSVATLPPHTGPAAQLANALYGYTFEVLDRLFGTAEGPASVGLLYQTMSLLGDTSRHLMTVDIGNDKVAGPPFRPHKFARDADRGIQELARAAAAADPSLMPIAEAVEAVEAL